MLAPHIPEASTELVLTKQTSLGEELHTRNGQTKAVHIIVKKSPFVVTFDVIPQSALDLHQWAIEIKLVYDDDHEKTVDYVKDKPMQCKPSVNQAGSKLTLDVRLGVLSSQLEKSCFKVAVFLLDGDKKVQHIAFSETIKVISKSNQFKPHRLERERLKQKQLSRAQNREHHLREPCKIKKEVEAPPVVQRRTSVPPPPDTNTDDSELEAGQEEQLENLLAIEERLDKHNATLQELSKKNNTLLSLSCTEQTAKKSPSSRKRQLHSLAEALSQPPDFEKAFADFLRACDRDLAPAEKRQKVRNAIGRLDGDDSGNLSEFLDMMWTEGLSREICQVHPHYTQSSRHRDEPCDCLDCSHKKELVRIEDFCDDIFSLG